LLEVNINITTKFLVGELKEDFYQKWSWQLLRLGICKSNLSKVWC